VVLWCCGTGVQDLLVSDIIQRDCLRVGVDQAGYGPLSRDREIRHVRDLPGTPGVAQGNTIHIEEALNLTNVWIHDNVCNNSMDAGGTTNMRMENNLIYGQVGACLPACLLLHALSLCCASLSCRLSTLLSLPQVLSPRLQS
jgi:hypothetical protein